MAKKIVIEDLDLSVETDNVVPPPKQKPKVKISSTQIVEETQPIKRKPVQKEKEQSSSSEKKVVADTPQKPVTDTPPKPKKKRVVSKEEFEQLQSTEGKKKRTPPPRRSGPVIKDKSVKVKDAHAKRASLFQTIKTVIVGLFLLGIVAALVSNL